MKRSLLEIHSHTKEHSPCREIYASDLIARAVDKGLQGIVFTDHHYLWRDEELEELRVVTRCRDDFVILSGQEVTTRDFDDVLVYGSRVAFPYGISIGSIRAKAPDAAIVWAHPYRGLKRPRPDKLFSPELDGIEIFNCHHRLTQNIYAYKEWLKWGFVATAGTDVHDEKIGIFPCAFDEKIVSIYDLSLAIKNGKCRPYTKTLNGPI